MVLKQTIINDRIMQIGIFETIVLPINRLNSVYMIKSMLNYLYLSVHYVLLLISSFLL